MKQLKKNVKEVEQVENVGQLEKSLSFKVKNETLKKIKIVAIKSDLTVTEFIRQIVEKAVESVEV